MLSRFSRKRNNHHPSSEVQHNVSPKGGKHQEVSTNQPVSEEINPKSPLEDTEHVYEHHITRLREVGPDYSTAIEPYVKALQYELAAENEQNKKLAARLVQFEQCLRETIELLPPIESGDETNKSEQSAETPFEKITRVVYTILEQRDNAGQNYRNLKDQHKSVSDELNGKIHSLRDELTAEKQTYKQLLKKKQDDEQSLRTEHDQTIQLLNGIAESTAETHQRAIMDLELRLLNTSDGFQPKPDKDFDSELKSLKVKVKGISRCTLKVTKEEIGVLFDQEQFVNSISAMKTTILVVEGALWQVLQDRLLSTPFAMFGDVGDAIFRAWCHLFRNDSNPDSNIKDLSWPIASIQSDSWRRTTVQNLHESIQLEDPCNSIVMSHKKNLDAITSGLRSILQAVSATPSDYESTIKEIVQMAVKLATECFVQKCRIQPLVYTAGTEVHGEVQGRIINLNDSKGGTGDEVVQLFVSPGLERIGDGKEETKNQTPTILGVAHVFVVNTTWSH